MITRAMEARAYVQTRFYPPLPLVYGDHAVTALDRIESGEETPIDLGDIQPWPRGAYTDERGELVITPRALLHALRLTHMIDTDD